jgi:glycosyltransferase involved in cell wall biosynthesis
MKGGGGARPREGVSVIIPVFNEEQSITRLLEALEGQTLRPAEIVVADGGSTDRTRELVRDFAARADAPVVLVETERGLPGRNRNLALARASREWAACIDAGTVPRPDWLERLVEASERESGARVVYGRYEPLTDSFFTRCSAILYLPPPREAVRSTASMLMHRAAWEAAGPFREDLRSAEDLLFFRALDAARVPSTHARDAVVSWELKRNVADTFRKFTAYARSNMSAGLAREWQYGVARFYALLLAVVVVGLFFRPALLLAPLLLLARAARRVWRWRPRAASLFNLPRLLMVVWLNLVIDAATLRGTLQWLAHDRVGEGRDEVGG